MCDICTSRAALQYFCGLCVNVLYSIVKLNLQTVGQANPQLV